MGSYLKLASDDLPDVRSQLLARIPDLKSQLSSSIEIRASFYCSPEFVVVVLLGAGCVVIVCCCVLYVKR